MKKSVLFFGPLPPPYYGPSISFQALLRSRFPEIVNVFVIKTNIVRSVAELYKFKLRKMFILLTILCQELFILTFHKIDYVCSMISFNKSGFLKDMTLIWVARVFRCKIVLWAHGNGLPTFYEESGNLLKLLIKKTISKADAGVVLGRNLVFNFSNFLPQDKILIAPLGIEKFRHAPRIENKRDDTIVILFLSNLAKSKGYFDIIQAIPFIVSQKRNVKFVFAGDIDSSFDKDEVFSYIRKNGIENFIEFKGKVIDKEKIDTYYNSDVFVFPTYYRFETFGLVNLEAMQAGLPIITTARGAIPEIIENGVNGLLVKEKDPIDLAEKIFLLIENVALRKKMGENNIKKFNELYTHEKYGERMINVFNSLS